jgi:ferredoxin
MPGRIARIVVDRDLCIGSGICIDTAPSVFELDDSATATVVNPEGESEQAVIDAAKGCPTCAIQLFDAAGAKLFPNS